MYKRIIFLVLILYCSLANGFAQVSDFSITQKTIGKTFLKNKDIRAKEYTFISKVESFHIDSINNYALIQLRNTTKGGNTLKNDGSFILFDLNKDSILWEKPMDYSTESLYFYDSSIVHTTEKKINILDKRSGEILYTLDNSLYYISPDKNIALAYKTSLPSSSNLVEAIDIKTGTKLWERKIGRENGWDNTQKLNDSLIVIYSDAIYTINLRDGKGIDFTSKTVEKKYTKAILMNTLNIAFAIMSDSYDLDIEDPERINYLQSDILLDSSYFYYASKDKLYKFHKDGTIIFTKKFEKKKISRSTLVKKDSVLYMINNGYALKNGEMVDYGTPFLAAFNANTGHEIFSNVFNDKKKSKESVLDYKIEGREIIILFKQSIARYSLDNGDLLIERKIKNKEYGEIVSFVKDDIYRKDEGNYKKIIDLFPRNYNIYTSYGLCLSLNKNFSTQELIPYQDIYFQSFKTKDKDIISSDTILSIINKIGQPIMEIPYFNDAIIVKEKLFFRKEKTFSKVDLSKTL